METQKSQKNKTANNAEYLAQLLNAAAAYVNQNANLVDRVVVAQQTHLRTVECTKSLQAAFDRAPTRGNPIGWVATVLPILGFAEAHVPRSLEYNAKLTADLIAEGGKRDGIEMELFAVLRARVDYATEQLHVLRNLILKVHARFKAGLAD